MSTKPKINPSSMAFMKNNEVHTKQQFGCIRNTLLLQNGVKTGSIPEILAVMGDQHEVEIGRLLDKACRQYVREEWLPIDMEDFDLRFRGRVDYHLADEKTVIECKALASKPKRSSIIRKGNVPLNHVAQVTSYMYQYKYTTGWLVYSYYQYAGPDTNKIVCPAPDRFGESRRWFKVTIDDDGAIYIDGERYEYSFIDLMLYIKEHEYVMKTKEIPSRPFIDISNPYSSPCTYCSWATACDKVDAAEIMSEKPSLEQFIEWAEEVVHKESDYDLFRPKRELKEYL